MHTDIFMKNRIWTAASLGLGTRLESKKPYLPHGLLLERSSGPHLLKSQPTPTGESSGWASAGPISLQGPPGLLLPFPSIFQISTEMLLENL